MLLTNTLAETIFISFSYFYLIGNTIDYILLRSNIIKKPFGDSAVSEHYIPLEDTKAIIIQALSNFDEELGKRASDILRKSICQNICQDLSKLSGGSFWLLFRSSSRFQ